MNKLPDTYAYPAICAHYDNGSISVWFPDLDVATDGDDQEHALRMGRELLGLVMVGLEDDGDPIPAPSNIADLTLSPDQYTMMVDVYMPSIRMATVNKSVKRTVTLPAWLNAKAMECGINFSQVLQEALKEKLHLA